MANEQLNAKRAEAIRVTRGATRKISRLKTKVDVVVAHSEYDPRKSPKLIRKYTDKQLNAYMARVAAFNDRSTQFVPDAYKRPIPAGEFKPLHLAELQAKNRALDTYNTVKDIRLPGVDNKPGSETIGQRRDKMRSDRKMAGNPSVNDPYDPKVRKSTDITSRTAVKKLTRDAKKKAAPGWEKKELKRQIGEFEKMIGRIGDADMAAAVKSLTPGQFRTLWNDTNFATAISTEYTIYQSKNVDKEDKAWYETVLSDSFADANRLVNWAKTLKL